jgi:hypothetical protein
MREHVPKQDMREELRVHGKQDNASFQVIVLVSPVATRLLSHLD